MITRGYSSQTIHDITDHIDTVIVSHYEDNHGKIKYYAPSLYELVKSVIEEDIKNESDAAELKKILTNKKRIAGQKKKRQYENCKRMLETRAWEFDDIERYCFKNDVVNYNSFTTEQWQKLYPGKTLEDVQFEHLADVEHWYRDQNAPLICYPGQDRKTPKRIFDNFRSDLTINILNIMGTLYAWDMESLTIPVMNDLADKPVFTAKHEEILKAPGDKKNSVVIFTSEDGRRRTVITFDDAAFDDKDKTALFDYKDSNLLAYLLKCAMNYDGGTLPILIEKSKLIKATFGADRKATSHDYADVDRRLRKLSQAYIDNYIEGEWTGTFHLVDAVEKQDIDDRKYVAFYPSEYMKTQIEHNGVSQLPTDLKNKLTTETAKLLYAPLMLQRVRVYKKMRSSGAKNDYFDVAFHYGHFLRFMNFGDGNQHNNHQTIMSILEEYKQAGIFIHDYHYTAKTKTYTLRFNPLTDIEIQDLSYYFGDEYAFDNLDFKQMEVFAFIEG